MAHRESPWHICHECLDPLAHDLLSIASRFWQPFDVAKADRLNVECQQIREAARLTEAQRKQLDEQLDGLLEQMGTQTKPPRSFDVETLYLKYDIEMAAAWLKFFVSVAYGEDFERTLHEAKQRFYKLEFKASQMINGDVGNETTIDDRYAIQRLMKRHDGELRADFPHHERRPEREEMPDYLRAFEENILDEYIEIEHQIKAAASYLLRVSLLVQGKINASQATSNATEGGAGREGGKPVAPADERSTPLPVADSKQPAGPAAGMTPPGDDAMACYRAHVFTGMNQTQLAERMTEELGRPISQGQVSRWITHVEKWIAAGNVMPGLLKTKQNIPGAMDPQTLDLGARQDHRTPRQRDRRSEDSDD